MTASETDDVASMNELLSTLPLTACPACRSQAFRTIRIGSHRLKKCKSCGLRYAPAYANPDEIYVEGYFSGDVGNFGPGDIRHPDWDEYLAFVAQYRMDILEHVVDAPGRILDVGCGPGHTLAEAKRRGWDPVGVDLITDAVHTAVEHHGLDVRCCMLEDSGLPERSFDVVSATHVLEHQQDATSFLTSIARWAKPGGYLFIEVPNWMSVDRMGNADRWFGLRPLEHLGHYSPKTLGKTMRRIGFEPVAVHTTCYQFHRQTLAQALHDLGLDSLAPHLVKNILTVAGTQGDAPVHLPNAFMRRVLHGMENAAVFAKAGVVLIMTARVP